MNDLLLDYDAVEVWESASEAESDADEDTLEPGVLLPRKHSSLCPDGSP